MSGAAKFLTALAGLLVASGCSEENLKTETNFIVSTNSSTAVHAHTNRLAHEKSPYLIQHQHNPVDWFAWGDEAFAKARTENKPVFLSIGYSTCHWCHVMERDRLKTKPSLIFSTNILSASRWIARNVLMWIKFT